MSRREIKKDGTALRVLRHLRVNNGSTSKELKIALKGINNHLMDATLTTVKRKHFVSQEKKGQPYFITARGDAAVESFDGPLPAMPLRDKKPGAPKKTSNGAPLVTNGIIKFSRPASMSTTMFSELVSEHSTAERRCEAIENLFQSWPR